MIILTRLQASDYKSLRDVDLTFPRQGSILVEGLNEAGKSTLFESIVFALYGEPLVREETGSPGRGAASSAIHYAAESAGVVLALDVDGTQLQITRSLRRRGASEARLVITAPDGIVEEVAGVRAVNSRVLQELGGLDQEALLNSCFVEQKKLAKLEELGGAARRESLEHLLNLDKLQVLQDEVRVTTQDRNMGVFA